MPRKPIEEARALEAISGTGGFISVIAGRLGVSHTTVYNLMQRYPSVAEAIEAERERQTDYTESQLFNLIRQGNVAAIIFYLKTKGKGRGYVERVEMDSLPQRVDVVVRFEGREQWALRARNEEDVVEGVAYDEYSPTEAAQDPDDYTQP